MDIGKERPFTYKVCILVMIIAPVASYSSTSLLLFDCSISDSPLLTFYRVRSYELRKFLELFLQLLIPLLNDLLELWSHRGLPLIYFEVFPFLLMSDMSEKLFK